MWPAGQTTIAWRAISSSGSRNMKISRREFVDLGLAAGAAAASPGCRPVFVTQLLGRAGTGKRPTGPIRWVNSACLQCRAGCGIRVKTIAGNAIKIEGNPLHPINRGRLCPKGQAGLQVLYDPDRIQGPCGGPASGAQGTGNAYRGSRPLPKSPSVWRRSAAMRGRIQSPFWVGATGDRCGNSLAASPAATARPMRSTAGRTARLMACWPTI